MNCPVCHHQSGGSICPSCGITLSALKKIKETSRWFFAQGLRKAAEGEYEGALEDLHTALQYDKTNTDARNVIGLIRYRRGEIGESVRQWTLSLYCKKEGNRAGEYLQGLQKNQRQYDTLCDSLILYNEALAQARKGDMEFTIVRLRKAVGLNKNFVRAYLLLALCYIQTNNLKKAEAVLDKAEKIEPLRIEIHRYRELIQEKRLSGQGDAGQEIQDFSRDFYVRQTMNQPDMKEISSGKRDRKVSMKSWSGPIMQILLFAIGALCCFGFVSTLYVPARISDYKEEALLTKNQLAGFQNQNQEFESALLERDQTIAEYKDQAAKYQKEIEDLRRQNEEQQASAQGEYLLQAAEEYIADNDLSCAETLFLIQQDRLSEKEQDFFTRIYAWVQPKVVGTYSGSAYNLYEAAMALEGEAKTEGLEKALSAYQKAYFFSKGTERESRHLFHQANIYYQLGRNEEALQMLELFFSSYTGSTSADLYIWADAIRKDIEGQAAE